MKTNEQKSKTQKHKVSSLKMKRWDPNEKYKICLMKNTKRKWKCSRRLRKWMDVPLYKDDLKWASHFQKNRN
jgi:hypothetical protein